MKLDNTNKEADNNITIENKTETENAVNNITEIIQKNMYPLNHYKSTFTPNKRIHFNNLEQFFPNMKLTKNKAEELNETKIENHVPNHNHQIDRLIKEELKNDVEMK